MNSKKNNQDVPPAELAEAVAAAETVLVKLNKFAEVLAETGHSIPRDLAAERELTGRLGVAEIASEGVDELRAELDTVRMRREGDWRRRTSACQGLLMLEDDLRRVHELVAGQQRNLAAGMVADHSRRWQEACDVLAALRAEGQALSSILGASVPMPSPFTAGLSLTTGLPEVRSIGPAPAAVLSPVLASATGMISRLDTARGLVADLQQVGELTNRYSALARNRGGGMPEAAGVYEVVRDFVFLGTKFTTGMLVDQEVVNPAMLHRFWQGRQIQPLVGSVVAAV